MRFSEPRVATTPRPFRRTTRARDTPSRRFPSALEPRWLAPRGRRSGLGHRSPRGVVRAVRGRLSSRALRGLPARRAALDARTSPSRARARAPDPRPGRACPSRRRACASARTTTARPWWCRRRTRTRRSARPPPRPTRVFVFVFAPPREGEVGRAPSSPFSRSPPSSRSRSSTTPSAAAIRAPRPTPSRAPSARARLRRALPRAPRGFFPPLPPRHGRVRGVLIRARRRRPPVPLLRHHVLARVPPRRPAAPTLAPRPDAPAPHRQGDPVHDPPLPRRRRPTPHVQRKVCRHVIDAACALDWPRSKLRVQILDDSTCEETKSVIDDAAFHWRERGVDVVVRRRATREGTRRALMRDVAARTSPRSRAVRRLRRRLRPRARVLTPDGAVFRTERKVGFVQARWTYANAASTLTRVQENFLNYHIRCEQYARHAAGLFFNFNGTAECGAWRASTTRAGGITEPPSRTWT